MAHLRDDNCRTLHQASRLASGHITDGNHSMFLVDMNDDQIATIDPATDLYPFMVLASGETSDLSAVYRVLRRDPSLACSTRGCVSSGKKRARKRKRAVK